MRTYKRAWIPGGCYFFTVNLAERHNNTLLIDHIDSFREVFRHVQVRHPFKTDAIVVLPDHLHCIWTLPPGDNRFDMRWYLIKSRFSHLIKRNERVSSSRLRKGERGIWQRRYWEHAIRDEQDWRNHVDYIHYNPVKHGHVMRARDWPHSSFHKYMNKGMYPYDWVSTESGELDLE
ncbi:MAG: transposase [Steroidobacter sp.]